MQFYFCLCLLPLWVTFRSWELYESSSLREQPHATGRWWVLLRVTCECEQVQVWVISHESSHWGLLSSRVTSHRNEPDDWTWGRVRDSSPPKSQSEMMQLICFSCAATGFIYYWWWWLSTRDFPTGKKKDTPTFNNEDSTYVYNIV